MKRLRATHPYRGFSLLETTMATLLVSITLVASLNSLAFVAKTTRHDAQSQRAAQIAQVLLAEISSRPFADPLNATAAIGLESGEPATRAVWDDCDDYHGWNTTAITTLGGQPLLGASGWNAQVVVAYCDPTNPNSTLAGPTQLKRITLSLLSPAGRTYSYSSLRCANGVLLAAQPTGTNVLSSVEISLLSASQSLTSSSRVHNQQEPN